MSEEELSTREKILLKSEEEFAKYGYDSVSMNSLVEAIGVNKATVYYHFKNKRELYHQVFHNILEEINDEISYLLDSDLKTSEMLRSYIDTTLFIITKRSSSIPLFFREMANCGDNFDKDTMPCFDNDILILKKILKQDDIKNKYKNISPYALLAMIQGAIKTFSLMLQIESKFEKFESLLMEDKDAKKEMADLIYNVISDAIIK